MSDKTQNLDRLCAHFGYKMCEQVGEAFQKDGKIDKAKTENLITKSLGVLQEDGVYAFFLYLASQVKPLKDNDKEEKFSIAARTLADKAAALLADDSLSLIPKSDYKQAMENIRKENGLADNLDDLLLAKRLLEQALIYARYHAKALGD